MQLIHRVYYLISLPVCFLMQFILLLLREPIFLTAIAAILKCSGDVVMSLVVLPYEIGTCNGKENDYQ